MDNSFKWLMIMFIVAFIAILIGAGIDNNPKTIGAKLDNCVKLANEIGLSPNDNERSDFIKDCYEK